MYGTMLRQRPDDLRSGRPETKFETVFGGVYAAVSTFQQQRVRDTTGTAALRGRIGRASKLIQLNVNVAESEEGSAILLYSTTSRCSGNCTVKY